MPLYYQDITNHDYSDTWNLGGDSIDGMDCNSWVAGYATTASIAFGTVSDCNASATDLKEES